jgi:hypothetical protein
MIENTVISLILVVSSLVMLQQVFQKRKKSQSPSSACGSGCACPAAPPRGETPLPLR